MDAVASHSDRSVHSVARLLLSHHPPQHRHRTLRIPGTQGIRVCTRCLGIAGGAVCASAAAGLGWPWATPGGRLGWLLPLMILPAVIDFHGQLMRRWESSNPRRLLSGGSFGLVLGWAAVAATCGHWQPAGVLAVGLLVYFGWLAAGRRRVARLGQHMRLYVEYYERCRAEDTRRAAGAVRIQPLGEEEDQ